MSPVLGRAIGKHCAPRCAERWAAKNRSIKSCANVWVPAFKGGQPSPGNFLNAGPISETVCLAAVALRAGRVKSGVRVYPAPVKLLYDSVSMKITNLPEANKYLTRDYRPGWEL